MHPIWVCKRNIQHPGDVIDDCYYLFGCCFPFWRVKSQGTEISKKNVTRFQASNYSNTLEPNIVAHGRTISHITGAAQRFIRCKFLRVTVVAQRWFGCQKYSRFASFLCLSIQIATNCPQIVFGICWKCNNCIFVYSYTNLLWDTKWQASFLQCMRLWNKKTYNIYALKFVKGWLIKYITMHFNANYMLWK